MTTKVLTGMEKTDMTHSLDYYKPDIEYRLRNGETLEEVQSWLISRDVNTPLYFLRNYCNEHGLTQKEKNDGEISRKYSNETKHELSLKLLPEIQKIIKDKKLSGNEIYDRLTDFKEDITYFREIIKILCDEGHLKRNGANRWMMYSLPIKNTFPGETSQTEPVIPGEEPISEVKDDKNTILIGLILNDCEKLIINTNPMKLEISTHSMDELLRVYTTLQEHDYLVEVNANSKEDKYKLLASEGCR